MYLELKENIPHGTKAYPYTQYHIHKMNTSFQVPVHWHDELEIIYILKGVLKVSINGEEFIGGPDSLFVVNPRDLHLMGSDDTSVDYFTLLFPMEFISFQSDDALENDFLKPLRKGQLRFNPCIIYDISYDNIFCTIKDIIKVNMERHSGYELRTRILLLELLAGFMELPDMIHKADSGHGSNVLRDIISYIQEKYTGNISLRIIAKEFHMSEKYFSRYFKKHFQLTFSRYISHMRLSHAKKLLETSDMSVTDIAFASGFLSVSYFIRSFKSEYGTTPLSYRK